jgi:glycerol uptake facilitator-like aquaporin
MPRQLAAEGLGTALLLATVVGSGVMGVALADGNDAVALLANAGATAGMLYVLITILGPISGAHFNPAVSLAMAIRGEQSPRDALLYSAVQGLGAVVGVVIAHAMFGLDLFQPGTQAWRPSACCSPSCSARGTARRHSRRSSPRTSSRPTGSPRARRSRILP